MKLMFDRTPIDHKPDSTEHGYRVFNMTQYETNNIEGLSYMISHMGFAYKNCATRGRKEADFVSQEFLTLDFDGYMTVEDAIKKCETLDLLPMLVYYSFCKEVQA